MVWTSVSRVCCIALLLAPALSAQEPVLYELTFPNATHHEAEVRATFKDVSNPVLEIVMSRSSPGRYVLHEFARNMYNVRVHDEAGRPLEVSRPSPHQWNVSGHRGTVVFEYTLYGDMVDGTYNAIDLTHAHLNGPATFVWARGFERRPVKVHLEARQDLPWVAATQLVYAGDGWWSAPSRDFLMDSPIEFSAHKIREWTGSGVTFRMALHSAANDEAISGLARYCEAITIEAEGVFGAYPRYDNGTYTFLLDYRPYALNDAMEHRNSSVVSQTMEPNRRNYADSLNVIAHEFFHSWNVERIRPRSLEPFDFERANMSGELWFAEGVTNYYAPLILRRAGITSIDQFLANLTIAVNSLVTSPGSHLFDAAALSRMAPFFDGAPGGDLSNQMNTYVSYYLVGQALGAGLDLTIRQRFPGKSLDDWMRAVRRKHPDIDRPYTNEDLERALAETTGSAEFAHEVFTRYINGREAPDFGPLLAQAGFVLRKRWPGQVWLGAPWFHVSDAGVWINGPVLKGSPGYEAGLDRGDRIMTIDGKSVRDGREWDRLLSSHKPGDSSLLRIQGRAGERVVSLKWQESPQIEIVPFETIKHPVTPEIRAFREAWLGSKALRPLPPLSRVQ